MLNKLKTKVDHPVPPNLDRVDACSVGTALRLAFGLPSDPMGEYEAILRRLAMTHD